MTDTLFLTRLEDANDLLGKNLSLYVKADDKPEADRRSFKLKAIKNALRRSRELLVVLRDLEIELNEPQKMTAKAQDLIFKVNLSDADLTFLFEKSDKELNDLFDGLRWIRTFCEAKSSELGASS